MIALFEKLSGREIYHAKGVLSAKLTAAVKYHLSRLLLCTLQIISTMYHIIKRVFPFIAWNIFLLQAQFVSFDKRLDDSAETVNTIYTLFYYKTLIGYNSFAISRRNFRLAI